MAERIKERILELRCEMERRKRQTGITMRQISRDS